MFGSVHMAQASPITAHTRERACRLDCGNAVTKGKVKMPSATSKHRSSDIDGRSVTRRGTESVTPKIRAKAFNSRDDGGGDEIARPTSDCQEKHGSSAKNYDGTTTLKTSESFSARPIINAIPANKAKKEIAKMTSPERLRSYEKPQSVTSRSASHCMHASANPAASATS